MPVLNVTERAVERVLALRAAEPGADDLALRVAVTGVAGDEFTYDLAFCLRSEADATDVAEDHGGLPVLVAGDSVDRLQGATLDLPAEGPPDGFVLVNPHSPSPAVEAARDHAVEAGDGSLEDRVRRVLDEQVNPAIAHHGGQAELVKVEGDAAYLRVAGGCQGCGLVAVTLAEGIEVMLREAVPEIARVVDVTDHGAGTNPFFPSKA